MSRLKNTSIEMMYKSIVESKPVPVSSTILCAHT